MNRKDGGKGGRTREGALSWSPEENFRERGQRGTGARRRRFSEFFGVIREKKRDNCLISNKNH